MATQAFMRAFVDNFKVRARAFYFRADWESIVVLTVIGLCATGMFFMVAS